MVPYGPTAVAFNCPTSTLWLSMDTLTESSPLIVPTTADYLSARPPSFIQTRRTHSKDAIRSTFSLWRTQTVSFAISSLFLAAVVLWAVASYLWESRWSWWGGTPRQAFEWDDRNKWGEEEATRDVRYYAHQAGFDIVDEEVETEDGFLLRVHRVVSPRRVREGTDKGLFQSSGAFITSEERSLAFWLAEHAGYQVFLGNTRCVFDMGHLSYAKDDPRFWDWTIRDLATYDFPALINHASRATGHPKIAFIGHSQGTALAFLALALRPALGTQLSCFIALAPAVFAGPLTARFPLNLLSHLGWERWQACFGVRDFIPAMRLASAWEWVPPRVFAAVGYAVFACLFGWTDRHWRKTKVFRFTPSPVSSASMFWLVLLVAVLDPANASADRWCGASSFAARRCILDPARPRWFDPKTFPPLALYYGGQDYLVDAEKLLERLSTREGVRVIRTCKIECEHCDFYLAGK
ncbi:hypothetical protein HWV62_12366 [Athelia sp. TMB]|nr:hypothetical protein HWV62_12366 [Athelia sp. TMB]